MNLPHSVPRGAKNGGFTLIELTVVIFIIGIVCAIAFPQMLPAIVFSRLEGEARHLAAYGRQVLAEATQRRERHEVRFDLDNQEYQVVRWELPDVEEETDATSLSSFAQLRQQIDQERSDLLDSMSAGSAGTQAADIPELADEEELANYQKMNERFERFARQATEARAENIDFEEGIFDDVGPLFDEEDEFRLDDSMEPVEVEVKTPTLGTRRLQDEIRLSQIIVDGASFTEGVVEVEVTALGFMEKCAFYFQDDGQNFYTVVWDPVLSTTRFYDGWHDIE